MTTKHSKKPEKSDPKGDEGQQNGKSKNNSILKKRSIAVSFVNYHYKQIKVKKTETVIGKFQVTIGSQHFQFQTPYK